MLHRLFTAEFLAVLAGCWSVLSTLLAYRLRRWLTVHLENERQREHVRHNETLRTLSAASEPTAPPTLESLLGDEKQDWSLESSNPPSAPLDWSDDENETETLPGTPAAKRLVQSELALAKTPKPRTR